ncbi:DUF1801 domain-containing protein [Nocardioides sp. CCNWLW239]|uniref:iron chaperone n=1 Tax=Nocardioides sp. CCNWLW239 TaxID=3128902 RepID=UPI00301AF5AB
MSDPVMDYLSGIEPAKRALIEHYYELVRELFPEAVPGKKYAMACYTLRGKGLVSVVATKAGLSVIPFSGSLNAQVAGEFEVSEGGGSLYCTVEHPLPDDAFSELVRLRAAQIA